MRPETITEWMLENWRSGSAIAEQMCAQLLTIEGFEGVDPQAPLGGPDGRKDILCTKSNWRYLAACYFPTERKSRFKDIKDKFIHDFAGVSQNGVDGIVFMTGQKISIGERKKLEDYSEKLGKSAIIYHQERIKTVLSQTMGLALRLQYLSIEMNAEEQLAFVLDLRSIESKALKDALARMEGKIDGLLSSSDLISSLQGQSLGIMSTMSTLGIEPLRRPIRANNPTPEPPALRRGPVIIDYEWLLDIHSAMMFERGGGSTGSYRKVDVWIGELGASKKNASFVPPPFSEVEQLMKGLLDRWNDNVMKLAGESDTHKIEAITRFHYELMKIHPFLDGNGSVGRFLIQQQATGLNLTDRLVDLSVGATYYRAMKEARGGNITPLRDIIYQAITGKDAKA